ncbi:ABC transporter permease [Cryptosporangium phraense]|uniref:ABC transporter permease n=1 Tax=Cryptosporangium phraense TaxID=2593070 RepID=A0A545ALF8_9ACTN|nr:ABC transporter permease [Cryptosporangium phraense]TQS42147.1 ABC transporter permease [Cryptosporangium phraense]
MKEALHAEWTKLRTAPATPWSLPALVLTTSGLSLVASASVTCPCATDTMKLALTGIQLGQAVAALFAVGVLGGEYSTGMIMVTFAAMPGRARVLAAKAVLAAGCVAAAGAAGIGVSYLGGRALLGPDLPDAVARPVAGSVLYLVLIALLGLGATAVTRSSAGATGLVLGLLYAAPIVAALVPDPVWRRHLHQFTPADAGLAVQATRDLAALPIAPWAGLGVVGLWAVGALMLGTLVLTRRDA